MTRRNWNKEQPISLPQAMHLCVQYAKEKKNLSVERIADLTGVTCFSTLYKWIGSGRMPAASIAAFEHACGINYITRYQAHSSGYLLIPIPNGRKAEHPELIALNLAANETVGMILKFQEGQQTAEETVAAITTLMEDLALQRGNVEKHQQPDLGLEG